ncbi:amidohydrolase [Bacillus massiliigorillae]|uniref:amidohydrolase n=1 Tax=Bacillus massiliigorillae TaxID=1243664 RepID=UPI0003A26849|nr:amidohydrolase family protein [Bacillus massiliigorillae]
MQQIPADVIIDNVLVLTMNRSHPKAKGIAVKDGKFIGLLDEETTWPLAVNGTHIDGQGMTLLPGLIDAHCHLRAQISHDHSVHCGRDDVQNISEIVNALRNKANQLEAGAWIRATGYDPFHLEEQRHPTRWDLDKATSQHPIRLRHITRHVSVLNSAALSLTGINSSSKDPSGITVERDHNGLPTGVIYGGDAWLSKKFVQPLTTQELQIGAEQLHTKLLSKGITAVQDATPTNTLFDLQFWNNCVNDFWKIAIQLMADIEHHAILTHHYQQCVAADVYDKLEIGAIKVVIEANPDLVPSPDELRVIALKAAQQQIPLAIHVVTPEMVWSALDAIRYAKELVPNHTMLHRLEHLSLCPDGFLSDIHELGVMVVTNPSLIYHHGDRYLKDVDSSEQSWLYRMNSLRANNITVAAGSDAPVASFDPWIGIGTACTRKTISGKVLSVDEKLSRWESLELYTTTAARAAGWEMKRGMIHPGFHADFILIEDNPLTCSIKKLSEIQVNQTWLDGKIAYMKQY